MNKKALNIVLADDDKDDCIFFREALVELNVPTNVIVVSEGEELMQLLNIKSRQLPHILFLDINMPRKNGFECLSEIKQSSTLQNIPVVIFTTSYEQETVNLLYDGGAHYFIRKPSEFVTLKKIIQQTIIRMVQEKFVQPSRGDFVLTAGKNFEM